MPQIHSGLQNLRRYFELIIFQSYLQSIEPDTMQSFETVETYVTNRPGTLTNIMPSNHLKPKPID